MAPINTTEFEATGKNAKALFTLKIHRGEGMLLLAMNWKNGKPSEDFVGFSIEYKEPDGDKFYSLPNRLSFPDANGKVNKKSTSSLQAPFQKFRWVHFPRNAEMKGDFIYRVTPVFMNSKDELSYGEAQEAPIQLMRETYKGKLNVSFTRGFISSQAFVDRYEKDGGIKALIPGTADEGLNFKPKQKTDEAYKWMGFEARSAILELLDDAIKDKNAEVRVVAYDLNLPEMVTRFEQLGSRLKIIIDNDGKHGQAGSPENEAEKRLKKTTPGNVKRQKMGKLQHNKTIVVSGTKINKAICGSTNFSWRGFYVQANNAIVINGKKSIQPFIDAFENYWNNSDDVKGFGNTVSAEKNELSLPGIDAIVSFSPHIKKNLLLDEIAMDLENKTTSSLFYSLAFLFQTEGSIKNAISKLMKNDKLFVYGISDKKVGGLDVQKPDGNIAPVYPSEISKNLPEPFKSEPKGGSGNRMHHKFAVIDFNKPTARVYMGSYNFSVTADKSNGENLLLIKDRKIAVSYMIEALRLIDHYHFRITQKEAKKANKLLALLKPPRKEGEKLWWEEYYTDKRKIRDRELFA